MPHRLLYVTAPSIDIAQTIARDLLEARLIACANILPGMLSIYRWDGVIQEESEVVLLAKTVASQVESAIARIKALHPYDCPCIISLEMKDGFPPFLNWISDETCPAN